MPKDKVVQPDAVEETASTTEETSEGETTEEQPFTEAQQAKLNEMITQAKADAEQAGFQKGSRDMQGKKDREVAQAQRDARYYQDLSGNYEKGFGGDDPERAEVIRLRAESETRKRADFATQQEQARTKFDTDFRTNMTQVITSFGVDPNDKEIDWAEEETKDYLAKQRRIFDSVSKIVKSAKDKVEQQRKDAESKLNEEANSVDTSASGGAGTKDWRKLSAADQIKAGLKDGQQKRK